MLDDLHGDRVLAPLGQDAPHVGEGTVEEAETARPHITRPLLQLQQGVLGDIEVLQVALHLGGGLSTPSRKCRFSPK